MHTNIHFISNVLLRHVSAQKGSFSRSRTDIVSQQINKIYLFVFGATAPQGAKAYSFTRFLDHTQRRARVGRTPLDE